jgi:hypothetical protein
MPRKPNGKTEIVVTPGKPFVVGKALKAKSLSSGFLTAYQEHFENEGSGIFSKMYQQFPSDYFWGLVKLAQIRKWRSVRLVRSTGRKTAKRRCAGLRKTLARMPCWRSFSIRSARQRLSSLRTIPSEPRCSKPY